jgi:hypothetical protein
LAFLGENGKADADPENFSDIDDVEVPFIYKSLKHTFHTNSLQSLSLKDVQIGYLGFLIALLIL